MKIDLPIVYQDEYLVVVDKPAGMAAEPAKGWTGPDVVSTLDFPTLVVSRLDVGTSGLMLLPKTEPAYLAFKKMYQDHLVEKVYLALVEGWLSPRQAVIDAPIQRRRAKDMRFGVMQTGRPALTQYRVIDRYLGTETDPMAKFDLVEARPKTGRTHQIRVHFSAVKHPVVGDQMYGSRRFLDLGRFWLHASELHLTHPFLQTQLDLFSELPDQLQNVLIKCKIFLNSAYSD